MNIQEKINKAVNKINKKGYTVLYVKSRHLKQDIAKNIAGNKPQYVVTTTQGRVLVATKESVDLGSELVNSWDYIIQCKGGHKQTIKHESVSLIKSCPFCEGRRYTGKQVHNLLQRSGMSSIVEEVTVDHSNNDVVKQNAKVRYTCSKGHKTNERLQQTLSKVVDGKVQCTLCCQSAYNYPTSRGEEIIQHVLEVNGIDFDREVPVSSELRSLKFDFILHDLKTIIEYDGEHHKYGGHGGKNLDVYKRNDATKDRVAKEMGYTMLRIQHTIQGMRIVWFLKESLATTIDIFNPMYKDFVKKVYDLTSELYGWEPMRVYQERADIYIRMRKTKAVEYTGLSASILQRAYDIAYGIPLSEYRKTEEYIRHGHGVDFS